MKSITADYQNLNSTTRTVLTVVGISMLGAFYVVAMSGSTLGSSVYLGVLSIVPITMAIIGWSPIMPTVNVQHAPLPSPAH